MKFFRPTSTLIVGVLLGVFVAPKVMGKLGVGV